MNTFSPFFPALIRLRSTLANNTLLNILALMNTFFPFFSALIRLRSALMGPISALGNNTAFGAYEHVRFSHFSRRL
jgi:hypothetical protein